MHRMQFLSLSIVILNLALMTERASGAQHNCAPKAKWIPNPPANGALIPSLLCFGLLLVNGKGFCVIRVDLVACSFCDGEKHRKPHHGHKMQRIIWQEHRYPRQT